MDIQLNFINRSNDANDSQIVIFQKNVAAGADELAVAWQVIEHCGTNENHPFTFPMELTVSSSDSWNNYTPHLPAASGNLYHVQMTGAGDTLSLAGSASSSAQVQVRNDLQSGAVSAGIYRSGKLLAHKTSIAPGQKAVFEFKPTIWIGVVSEAEQGMAMDSAIMSNVNTELGLLGIASADIVMTGGGPGAASTPYAFNLENIQMA